MAWVVAWQEARLCQRSILYAPETAAEIVTIHRQEYACQRIGAHEIQRQGRLYDIRWKAQQGDSVRLALCHDAREQALLQALQTTLIPSQNDTPAGPLRAWLNHWLNAAFMPSSPPEWRLQTPERERTAYRKPSLPEAQAAPAFVGPPPRSARDSVFI